MKFLQCNTIFWAFFNAISILSQQHSIAILALQYSKTFRKQNQWQRAKPWFTTACFLLLPPLRTALNEVSLISSVSFLVLPGLFSCFKGVIEADLCCQNIWLRQSNESCRSCLALALHTSSIYAQHACATRIEYLGSWKKLCYKLWECYIAILNTVETANKNTGYKDNPHVRTDFSWTKSKCTLCSKYRRI